MVARSHCATKSRPGPIREMSRVLGMGAAAATLLMAAAAARVGNAPLTSVIHSSERIVVARVESVELVGGVRIGRATVLRSLKGSASGESLRFVAEPTWRCDVSAAAPGETSLLFLAPYQGRAEGLSGKKLANLTARVAQQYGPTVALSEIAHWGRGRLPVVWKETSAYVTSPNGSGLIFPAQLKPARPDRLLPLSDVEAFILEKLAPGRAPKGVAARK